jgi:hypothetical protein
MFLIAFYNGVYEALFYVDEYGFAADFDLEVDFVPGEFTEITEL